MGRIRFSRTSSRRHSTLGNSAFIICQLCLAILPRLSLAAEFYFPQSDANWEHAEPAQLGWDTDLLEAAIDVAEESKSSGVLILHHGRILAERYWQNPDNSQRYTNFLTGRDAADRAIEDVASAQKNVTSLLVGMAQERGYLTLDDSISDHLGSGWSAANTAQESAITIRHLLSMNSGLAPDLSFVEPPNKVWLYNTPAYHMLMRVVTSATGMERNALTREWITAPLGMENSSWTPRPWASSDIAVGFSTTARELARFGLMIQAGGRWHDDIVIADTEYLQEMVTPSQQFNPSYGFLWWLNGQEFTLGAGRNAPRRDGSLIASAPEDLIAMQGALDRKLYIVPSLGLLVARLGSNGVKDGESFNDAFWSALMRAAPGISAENN